MSSQNGAYDGGYGRRAWMTMLAILAMVLGIANSATAGPMSDRVISDWGSDSLTIIVDGTSNTILLGEDTSVATCFRNVRLPGITDGTSNTILFNELPYEDVCQPNLRDLLDWEQAFRDIADGTSNTILLGETDGLALLDATSRIDICASNATTIVDGTSNTIAVGESLCFSNLRIPSREVAVPAPGTFALLLGALLLSGVGRRVTRRLQLAASFRGPRSRSGSGHPPSTPTAG